LADNYDCDIFIHTWSTIDHNTKTWHNYKVNKEISVEEIHNVIKTCYDPKAYKVEDQQYKDEGYIVADTEISLFGMHMMLHSMQECNRLRQEYEKDNNIKYDYIVMLRPDVELWNPLILETFIDRTDPQYLNKSLYFGGFWKNKTILNDLRFLGGSDVLFFASNDTMNNIFLHSEQIFDDIKNQQLSQYGPEYAFLHAIDALGIRLNLINYLWGNDFTIIRDEPVREKPESLKCKKISLRKKMIRGKLSSKMLKLNFLPVLNKSIFEIELNCFNKYLIMISFGKTSSGNK
jgi:hypothetical protein